MEEERQSGVWQSEIEWLYRLMPDDVLSGLERVIEYAIEVGEYKKCPVSCGTMRYLLLLIENERKIRRLEKIGMSYEEARNSVLPQPPQPSDDDDLHVEPSLSIEENEGYVDL